MDCLKAAACAGAGVPPVKDGSAECAWPGCAFRTQRAQARKAADRMLLEHVAARQLLEHYEAAYVPTQLAD